MPDSAGAVTWDDTRAWIGHELGPIDGADEVTRADIRRRLEVFAFDCPLHYDDEVAREHGYREACAPASMRSTFAQPPYWHPGDPPPPPGEPMSKSTPLARTIPLPGSRSLLVGLDVEYGEPLYPGDRIRATFKLEGVEEKTTRVGVGAFLTTETTARKQSGEIAWVERRTTFRYDRDPMEGGG